MLLSIDIDDAATSKPEVGKEEIIKKLANIIMNSKKIITVTGAGISVSAGIPDFRSADGLYSRVLTESNHSSPVGLEATAATKSIKGKDFFDASFFANPITRPLFYRFLLELRTICQAASPTPTHHFLSELAKQGKLLRWYTQNIDGLESQLGLSVSTTESVKKASVVALHGTMDRLFCTICKHSQQYDSLEHDALLRDGTSPTCTKCNNFCAGRIANGRRPTKSGIMRPDIVLYNEPHPQGEVIADYLISDLARRPSLLLVIGTSLKVVGLKKIIKDLAKTIHQDEGLVVFINKTAAPRSEWKTVFDYELLGECDRWISLINEALQNTVKTIAPVKQVQSRLEFKVAKRATANLDIDKKVLAVASLKDKIQSPAQPDNQIAATITTTRTRKGRSIMIL